MTDFSDQFRKIIMRHKRIGYNLNVMQQSACLVIICFFIVISLDLSIDREDSLTS